MKYDNLNPKSNRGFLILIMSVVIMMVAALGVVFALVLNSQSALFSFAGQETSLEESSDSSKPLLSSPTTQIIDLVSLMGLSEDDALSAIGHGATVQDQETLSSLGFSNEITVVLEAEHGDRLSGTPTVLLGFDQNGKVAAAAYEAPLSLLGYGDVAFAPAVKQFHIVEFMLAKVGVTDVEVGSVKLPDPSEYSTYNSDRKTLAREYYSFTGDTTEDSQNYSWEVTLDYDYTQANKKADLAYTVKRVSVAIMKS